MQERTWRCWFGLVVSWLLLLACQGPHARMEAKPGLMLDRESAAAAPPRAEAAAADDALAATPDLWSRENDARRGGPKAPAAVARLLIQRGQVQVEVVRPEDSAREFLAKVKAAGGYLQQQAGAVLTVRLPAAEFDAMFTAVKAMGRVLAEQRQAEDVTEEFVDLGIRIDNARKARDRLLEILQKAEKVEDILKVEAEVRRLTDEIERMEGRKKLLADQVAMATLQATFVAKVEPAPPPPPKRSRQLSPFDWINETGPETLLEGR